MDTPRPVPLYEGMGVIGVAGRLPKAGFYGSRQSGVGFTLKPFLGLGREWEVSRLAADSSEGGSSSWGLEGCSLPQCLERFWAWVSLPVAHYSDTNLERGKWERCSMPHSQLVKLQTQGFLPPADLVPVRAGLASFNDKIQAEDFPNPPLPRLGMRMDLLWPHGRLGFPRGYCTW